ncbi:mannitol-1-phosphate 5-dehydrogenase [Bacillus velezensis]|uniref:mannitol-1-phosphate 5-dehydrogenase n=1 Tax=Bacillus amyloliquefaciens group TaxID=1938374 RepID=UPI000CD5B2D2|nr:MULTISPECIES: mannitol-1-phosphate 5-dehydrogenase [Bacillus amyloliquefaciens group]AWM42976.1 mannitol-1-phosphate 5-dehydrogenase [Bacillus amyloliquefaciens]AWQ15737.1 mannitol-1-phosphate 5-dehydrogenase [Bacillus velezensis]MBL4960397.1 mannitol-1-phosphate 5-dehydrogenase [Bacillus velezensis]MDH3100528.1 mannitol-1-phosphate 5-dehydrogenase [Bacillus velezensis]MEE4536420.1 mannitol-1-phosphate 5-dehydrogenase [Bacillus velezensis]
MIALHFGAGNIGRGFIGALLHHSGYDVVFADVNETMVSLLNEKKEYTVELADGGRQTEIIGPVSAINSAVQEQELYRLINEAAIITTAVGPNVLRLIAPSIAEGLKRRTSSDPLNIIACENMIGGSSFLKKEVFGHLTEAERELVNRTVGFPDSAVDRIVPIQHHEDPLKVSVEPFFEWVIDRTGFAGGQPVLEGALFTDDLTPFIERKLFTVNTGHAVTAYVGYQRGLKTVKEAIGHPEIRRVVYDALSETGEYLVKAYGFKQSEHEQYMKKIIGRFENEYITDDVTRVARSPLRKLGANDRLVGPAKKIKEPNALAEGIAAALRFDYQDDPEAVELQKLIAEKGTSGVLQDICGIQPHEPLHGIVLKKLNQ